MIKGNNYNSIMEEHKDKNKLKGSDIKVDVVYEVFKNTVNLFLLLFIDIVVRLLVI